MTESHFLLAPVTLWLGTDYFLLLSESESETDSVGLPLPSEELSLPSEELESSSLSETYLIF